MSKSAIAALTEAQNIIAKSGVTVNLVGYIADKDVRKNWRNANVLAALIINSAANAFQCENSETLAKNETWFKNMEQAVTAYIDSNLDQWNQKEAAGLNLVISLELVRLEGMVNANMNFEAGVAAATAKKLSASLIMDPAEAYDIAIEVNERRRVAQFFGGLDYEQRRAKVDADHEEALKQNADYQAAIGVVANNLSLPVWDGASDTVKAEVIKHQRAQAEEGTGTIPPLVLDHAPTVKLHTSEAGTLQLFWDTLNEYQKEFLLGVAHDQALEIDAGLASLGKFRLPLPTQEEKEERYFRNLTDVELAYALENDIAPESRRHLYVAEAERRELQMAKIGALNELVSGASLEQAQARFVSRLTIKQLAEALFDPTLPADRRPAYAAEMQRRKGERVLFDDNILEAVITNLTNNLLVEAMNSHSTPDDQRDLYAQELQRRLSQTDRIDRGLDFLESTPAERDTTLDGFRSRAVIWRKN